MWPAKEMTTVSLLYNVYATQTVAKLARATLRVRPSRDRDLVNQIG